MKELPYVAKGYPYSTLCTLGLCIVIIAGQNYVVFTQQKIDWIGILVSYSGLPVFFADVVGGKKQK